MIIELSLTEFPELRQLWVATALTSHLARQGMTVERVAADRVAITMTIDDEVPAAAAVSDRLATIASALIGPLGVSASRAGSLVCGPNCRWVLTIA